MKNNQGYRYVFDVIDIFSKYAWGIPLKNKTAQTITNEFSKIILKSFRNPGLIGVNDGKDFVINFSEILWLLKILRDRVDIQIK